MSENEMMKEAAQQIQRSTIFAVFPILVDIFPRGRNIDLLLNLKAKYEEKTLTWRNLANAWREAFSDSQEDAQVKTMQNILDT